MKHHVRNSTLSQTFFMLASSPLLFAPIKLPAQGP
jgi:hypothetical protein